MRRVFFVFLTFAFLFLFPFFPFGVDAEAGGIGVGVGVGEIKLAEPLTPGGIYKLPSIPVINTGSLEGVFNVRAKLVRGPELANEDEVSSWFAFSPSNFRLLSDEASNVEITLGLSPRAFPGDYYLFLEAFQVQDASGQVTISPVAATKLYFSIKPTSILGAFRARVLTFIEINPLVYLILAALLFLDAFFILRRHFRLHFHLEPREAGKARKVS